MSQSGYKWLLGSHTSRTGNTVVKPLSVVSGGMMHGSESQLLCFTGWVALGEALDFSGSQCPHL